MAKRFVRITLAAKCRLLFGLAAIFIIGSALVVPWLYMEAMADDAALRAGTEVTRMYLNEWKNKHQQDQPTDVVSDLFTQADPGEQDPQRQSRFGPRMILFGPDRQAGETADLQARQAARAFGQSVDEQTILLPKPDSDREVYRIYHAVRATRACRDCHDQMPDESRRWRPNQLVGMIEAELPAATSIRALMIRRGVILIAGLLALVLASLTFYFITKRLILSPVRKLKSVADKVAEGDLTVRSEIDTGDEFEQLADSFDEMLEAVRQTQSQLRTANRALDLKLNELTESNVALHEANRLKSEFLANVSHELRTPLNSIIGFAELLSENADQRIQRYGGNILTPARMLLRIINDLLDLARIEAGRVKLMVTQVSVTDICETLISLVTPQAEKRNLNLSLRADEQTPIIETDAGKLQQILYNLLDNAVKFTPAGGSICLTTTLEADGDQVRVDVADTGPGISEADRARIFEKFYQADGSTTRPHGGAGLGLAIAKDLAELLGGQVRVSSEPGEGATFTLELPIRTPADDATDED